jgi:ATP-dependent helicase HrpB
VLVEPRRLAARAAARRIAFERGTNLGQEIGYHVRFDRKSSRATRLLVVTPGILLRMLQDDPYMEYIGAVVFDEFHERGLETDLALGIVRLLQQSVRPELRAVVMSATLATEKLASYLAPCSVVTSAGRLFPVEVSYQPSASERPLGEQVALCVSRILDATPGDVLVFLPGVGEIGQASRALTALADERKLLVLPLHGELPLEQQDVALTKQPLRRVVLATNVAETSVTVEGVTAVIDSGLARQLSHDPTVGLDRLELVPISKASAEQRAGRAGRLQPGICVRLWSESSHIGRPDQTEPEVLRLDLAAPLLQLFQLGESKPENFPWLDLPPASALECGLALLRLLGAIESSTNGTQLTPLGAQLAGNSVWRRGPSRSGRRASLRTRSLRTRPPPTADLLK